MKDPVVEGDVKISSIRFLRKYDFLAEEVNKLWLNQSITFEEYRQIFESFELKSE